MADFDKPKSESVEVAAAVKCPFCALTYADFKKIGRLGCGECYNAFKKYLSPLLKRIHGSIQHTGKSPLKSAKLPKKKTDAQELRSRLAKAIESEDFEEAARLRDQIRKMESGAQDTKE